MGESAIVENKKQKRQKAPVSLPRVAGEILAGTSTASTAAALAYLCFYLVGYGVKIAGLGEEGCMGNPVIWLIWGTALWVVPLTYVLVSALGVYLVGSRDSQTGSFLATLGGSFLGLFVTALLYLYMGAAEMYLMLGVEKIVLWPLMFLAPPIMATLCFNLTRSYKEPASP
jgi:hypothetical protein